MRHQSSLAFSTGVGTGTIYWDAILFFLPEDKNMADQPDRGSRKSSNRVRTITSHLLANKRTQTKLGVSTVSAVAQNSYNTEDYVLANNLLTPEQVQFYNKNGFLVVRNLVNAEDIRRYYESFRRICMKEVKVPGITIMKDVSVVKSEFLPEDRAVNKLQDFWNDDVLFSYSSLPQILKYVECFTGPNIKVINFKICYNLLPEPSVFSSFIAM